MSRNATLVTTDAGEVRGWSRVFVSRALMQAAGRFEIDVDSTSPTFLHPGSFVQILRGRTRILAGFVDSIDCAIRSGQSTRKFAGRDATADLVDSCADIQLPLNSVKTTTKKTWRNTRASQIAHDLAAPFGLKVLVLADTEEKLIPYLAVAPAETCFETIERALRLSGVLCFCDNGTRLAIGRPSRTPIDEHLVYGVNITDVSFTSALNDRFEKVVVIGQKRGSDGGFGELSASINGVAFDDDVPRPRTLVLLAETGVDAELAQRRAEWEVAVRAARAERLEVTVKGWERRGDGTGDLWLVNQRVRAIVPPFLLDSDFLVDSVTYEEVDKQGATTKLSLVRPDAYLPEPFLEKGKNPGAGFLSLDPALSTEAGEAGLEGDPDGIGEGQEER